MAYLPEIHLGLTPGSGALVKSSESCGQGPNLVFECEERRSFLIAEPVLAGTLAPQASTYLGHIGGKARMLDSFPDPQTEATRLRPALKALKGK